MAAKALPNICAKVRCTSSLDSYELLVWASLQYESPLTLSSRFSSDMVVGLWTGEAEEHMITQAGSAMSVGLFKDRLAVK